jgi:hypothetical protein
MRGKKIGNGGYTGMNWQRGEREMARGVRPTVDYKRAP